MTRLTIGALANRTGVSVRMLRHYDDIGLLQPATRSDAGYRLYGPDDVLRLQAVVALRQLGLGLRDIGRVLNDGSLSPGEAIALRLAQLDAELAERKQLHDRLRAIAWRVAQSPGDRLDDLVKSIEVMTDMERIRQAYTPEQLETLAQRRESLGEAGMRQAEHDWTVLIAEVKQLIADGVPASDPRASAAARQWNGLLQAFTGGDPGIERSLQAVWDQEEQVAGYDSAEMRQLGAYIAEATGSTE